eukprot:jgi/Galph1/5062/GphlegSOOS_G3788.1
MSLSTRIRFYLNEYWNELVNYDLRQPAKPWSEFFHKFSFQLSAKAITSRLPVNFEYFFPNYLRLFLMTMAIYIILHPWTFLLGLWWVLLSRRNSFSLGSGQRISIPLSKKQQFYCLLGMTIVVVIWNRLFISLFLYLGIVSLFILLHASFRAITFRAKLQELRTQVLDNW